MKSKVTNLEKIAFGFGMLANQMFPAALGIFIIVLIQDLGFAAIMWGILQFAPRLFDAITDPLMGFISDNTKSKWGRRRQYVLIGGLLMGISYIAMWQIYAENGLTYNFIYFLLWSLVFYLGLTIFSVPYVAMGYEMSDDFHERTQIMAIAQFIGQWAWVIAPWFWIILYDPEIYPDGADQGVRELSIWVAIACTLFAIAPAIFIRSKSTMDRSDFVPINAANIGNSIKDIFITAFGAFKIKPFRRIAIATFLVFNSFQGMPEGGKILISTAGTEICEPMLRDRVAVPKGAYVSISIQDKGCGIASDKLQKIFEPFYTTKRTGEGTGLGLSTVYGIVKQTGGYIFVDSSVGQGTIFTLLLPASDLPSQKAASPPSDIKLVANRPEGGAVLLVEDEATVRTFAARALRLCGYSVLVAESGERALEIAQNPTVKLDLFVTDVVMPGRGGPSWVREALQTRPHIRIIFMSGYAEDKLTADQSSVPNSIFLAKPFSLTQLASAVESQMP